MIARQPECGVEFRLGTVRSPLFDGRRHIVAQGHAGAKLPALAILGVAFNASAGFVVAVIILGDHGRAILDLQVLRLLGERLQFRPFLVRPARPCPEGH